MATTAIPARHTRSLFADRVAMIVEQTLPLLAAKGIDLDVYYVANAELFDLLSPVEQDAIFPESAAMQAMGLTGFTLPTMYQWIRSDLGRSMTLHPFSHGRYPGSGPGARVMAEAGLDGDGQMAAIIRYVRARSRPWYRGDYSAFSRCTR